MPPPPRQAAAIRSALTDPTEVLRCTALRRRNTPQRRTPAAARLNSRSSDAVVFNSSVAGQTQQRLAAGATGRCQVVGFVQQGNAIQNRQGMDPPLRLPNSQGDLYGGLHSSQQTGQPGSGAWGCQARVCRLCRRQGPLRQCAGAGEVRVLATPANKPTRAQRTRGTDDGAEPHSVNRLPGQLVGATGQECALRWNRQSGMSAAAVAALTGSVATPPDHACHNVA